MRRALAPALPRSLIVRDLPRLRLIVMRTVAFSVSRKRTLVRRTDSREMAGAVLSPFGLAGVGLSGTTPVTRPIFLPCSSDTHRVLFGPAVIWRGPDPEVK